MITEECCDCDDYYRSVGVEIRDKREKESYIA